MCPRFDDAEMRGSSKSYSRAMKAIADEWGVPAPSPFSGGERLAQMLELVRTVVREECREAFKEGRYRGLRLATENLPMDREDGLYVPAGEAPCHTGKVGPVKFCSFRGWPTNGHQMATAS